MRRCGILLGGSLIRRVVSWNGGWYSSYFSLIRFPIWLSSCFIFNFGSILLRIRLIWWIGIRFASCSRNYRSLIPFFRSLFFIPIFFISFSSIWAPFRGILILIIIIWSFYWEWVSFINLRLIFNLKIVLSFDWKT